VYTPAIYKTYVRLRPKHLTKNNLKLISINQITF